MISKLSLRAEAKKIRKNLDIQKISLNLCDKIKNKVFYKQAKNVMIFYPMPYEISLLSLINDEKNFYLPKVCGEDLLVCPYDVNLKKSPQNVYEPCTNPVDFSILDLVIVPALMVDKNGFRLGYGGGYYDRFLAKYNINTLTVIPKELYVESLPHDKFDIKIDNIIISD